MDIIDIAEELMNINHEEVKQDETSEEAMKFEKLIGQLKKMNSFQLIDVIEFMSALHFEFKKDVI